MSLMEAERFVMHLHGGLSSLENEIRNFRDLKHTSIVVWHVLYKYQATSIRTQGPCLVWRKASGRADSTKAFSWTSMRGLRGST